MAEALSGDAGTLLVLGLVVLGIIWGISMIYGMEDEE